MTNCLYKSMTFLVVNVYQQFLKTSKFVKTKMDKQPTYNRMGDEVRKQKKKRIKMK
uniref:Uncharacterized protein n=1 Tax=Octopus bimaculoides TaxID=37653 RepID=A0A0L8HQA8_OCTBM